MRVQQPISRRKKELLVRVEAAKRRVEYALSRLTTNELEEIESTRKR